MQAQPQQHTDSEPTDLSSKSSQVSLDETYNKLFPKEKITEADYLKQLLAIQDEMLKGDQIEMQLVHEFTPGIYMRTIIMPAGAWVIGKTHKTEHFNIVHTGKASVMMNGQIQEITAPAMFVSGCDVKKVLHIEEDMAWSTVHHIEDEWLVKDGDEIDIEASVEKLEPLMVCSFEEERKLIESEIKRLT
jgi:hypothetical protein